MTFIHLFEAIPFRKGNPYWFHVPFPSLRFLRCCMWYLIYLPLRRLRYSEIGNSDFVSSFLVRRVAFVYLLQRGNVKKILLGLYEINICSIGEEFWKNSVLFFYNLAGQISWDSWGINTDVARCCWGKSPPIKILTFYSSQRRLVTFMSAGAIPQMKSATALPTVWKLSPYSNFKIH